MFGMKTLPLPAGNIAAFRSKESRFLRLPVLPAGGGKKDVCELL